DPAAATGWARSPLCLPVKDWIGVSGAESGVAYVDGGWNWIVWHRVATYRFRTFGDSVEALPAPGVRAGRGEDLYRRSILPIVNQAAGAESIHASAVLLSEGVVAFCGERGAGKSTVAFGLSQRGFAQFADDSVVVEVRDGHASAIAFPFTSRLRRPS